MTKSPTVRLLLGLLFTVGAVMGFSLYALHQVHRLRKLQTDTIDLNRHDSLLLLQVQNDIQDIGLKLRDMIEVANRSGNISVYQADFNTIRHHLQQSVEKESALRPITRTGLRSELAAVLGQFWTTFDRALAAASVGRQRSAMRLVTTQLFQEQANLAEKVSELLERNIEAEEGADRRISEIYDGVERDVYAFLAATMLAILVTSLYLIYSNRKTFEQLESLSTQRRVLAGSLITVQEEVLRSVSRELHDEFGQILTAVGAMLARAERKGLPPDSPLRTELSEVRQITHNTLEKIRSLSQMLHPAVIDDYGLVKALEWYAETFERQNGIAIKITVVGPPMRIVGQTAIHCFRIVQEALNNAAKHSGTNRAEVTLTFSERELMLAVRDFGHGISQTRLPQARGLGLIAMRERAELLGGQINISSVPEAGTLVELLVPLHREMLAEPAQPEISEIVSPTK
jgi:signal transduction histidine kinase